MMPLRRTCTLSVVLAAISIVAGCAPAVPSAGASAVATKDVLVPVVEERPQSPPPAATEPPREVPLRTLDWQGVQDRVAAQRGKVVLVAIWTSTCETCKQEFPHLVALQEQRGGDGLACLAVNCDYDGIQDKPPEYYRPQVQAFLSGQRLPAGFENLLLRVPFADFLEEQDLSSTPAVYVYGRDGKLIKRFDNDHAARIEDEFTHADIVRLVEELLRQAPGEPPADVR